VNRIIFLVLCELFVDEFVIFIWSLIIYFIVSLYKYKVLSTYLKKLLLSTLCLLYLIIFVDF